MRGCRFHGSAWHEAHFACICRRSPPRGWVGLCLGGKSHKTNHLAEGSDKESGVDMDTSSMSRATRTGQGLDNGAIFV